eukprot:3441503-Rhodomonas_salina.2
MRQGRGVEADPKERHNFQLESEAPLEDQTLVQQCSTPFSAEEATSPLTAHVARTGCICSGGIG